MDWNMLCTYMPQISLSTGLKWKGMISYSNALTVCKLFTSWKRLFRRKGTPYIAETNNM